MPTNQEFLEHLFKSGQIDIRRGPIFDAAPGPIPTSLDFDRVEGMMLGLAIGDALGVTTEGMLPSHRSSVHGELRNYIPNRYVNAPIGFPSDDTQLAFWTMEQMLADGGFDPERVAAKFCRDRIFGIGSTVKEFRRNYKSGMPWYKCGAKSAGNGALMRIAPMLVPHLKSGTADLWADTALSAMMTHNDSVSIASCISFVNMLWQLLEMDSPPRPEWWLETFVEAAKELESDESYSPRGGAFTDYQGPLWRFVQEKVGEAHRRGLTVVEACDQWYSGAFLLETVPSVLFILMRHGNDLEEAIVRAVNDTKDNDTIAAIVGAAVGALHGKRRIPDRWLSNLSGRTGENDDGKVFHLLEEARRLWWDL
jgi:ADP-ribosylglycohydrolase